MTPGNSLILPKEHLQHSCPYIKDLGTASKNEHRELPHTDARTNARTYGVTDAITS